MAPTGRSRIIRRCVAAGLAALLAAGGAAGGAAGISLPEGQVNFDARSAELDAQTQQLVFHDVSMTQGDLSVTADRADVAGLKRENSRWTFTGNVHIRSGQHGNLASDRATIRILNGRIASALATGKPAEFEQTTSKSGVLARGHADSIEYTVDTGTVRLTGGAWLKYGDDVLTADEEVYNIKEQKLEGVSGAGANDRVHINILPRKGGKPGTRP